MNNHLELYPMLFLMCLPHFSSSTLKSSSSATDGSLVASKVTSSDTDSPSSPSLPLLGLGADITLNKPTCLFAIVESGWDQTSKCSRPATVCLVQSAAGQLLYAWFKVQQASYCMLGSKCSRPAIVCLVQSATDQLLYAWFKVQQASYCMLGSKCSRPAIVCLVQSAAAVGFQSDIMCTVIWLVVYTEHRTWLLIGYF